jgi:hypothetical protein
MWYLRIAAAGSIIGLIAIIVFLMIIKVVPM